MTTFHEASRAEALDRSTGRSPVQPNLSSNELATPAFNREDLQAERRPLNTLPASTPAPEPAPDRPEQIRALILEIRNVSPHGAQLAQDLENDLNKPHEVNQGINATCTMTTLQKQLAAEDPVAYAQMVRDLVVSGKVTFKDPQGSTVSFDPSSLAADPWSVPEPYEARSSTEKMMQNVLMRYAIGETDQAVRAGNAPLHYDQSTDTISGIYQGEQVSFRGLFEDQVMRAMQGVSGKKAAVIYDPSLALNAIENQLEAGKSVMVELKWADSGLHALHALSVDHIDHKTGTVYLFNPHGAKTPPPEKGAIQSISLAEFNDKFECAFVLTDQANDGKVPVPPPLDQVKEAHRSTDPENRVPAVLNLQVTPPVSEAKEIASEKTPTAPRHSPAFTVVRENPTLALDTSSGERAAKPLAAETRGKALRGTLFTSDDDDLKYQKTSRPAEEPVVSERTSALFGSKI